MSFCFMQLEDAAVKRWGSLEDLEAEKHKRVERKEKKALEKAKEAEKGTLLVDLKMLPSAHRPYISKCNR